MAKVKNVQEILNMLHVDAISRNIESRHKSIREAYRVPRYVPRDEDDCFDILVKYYQYHFSKSLGGGVPPARDMALFQVRQVLDKHGGGYGMAVKNALRGRGGGLIGLIDNVADAMEEQAVEQYFTAVLTRYASVLDFDYRVMLATQVLQQYGRHMLPGEHLPSPYELAARIDSFIKYLVKVSNSLRDALQ